MIKPKNKQVEQFLKDIMMLDSEKFEILQKLRKINFS